MTKGKGKKPPQEKLAEYAEQVREHLTAAKQNDVFQLAVAVGYVAATADGTFDDDEKKSIVDAVEILSKGLVIEWEVDAILEEHAANKKPADARAADVGAKLKAVGQVEAALAIGAFVAQATSGIDKAETAALLAIGKAAGVAEKRVKELLKTVGAG